MEQAEKNNHVTMGYNEGLRADANIKLKKESFLEQEIRKCWESDKDQIVNGYRNGCARTEHGVNAEYFHIGGFNAREQRLAKLEGREAILMEKSPAVNGPDDMIRGHEKYQMKYYRSAKGSLEGCIEHLEKYADSYGNNDDAYYIIPSEQYDDLIKIKNGEIPEGYSARTAETLKEKIALFENKKGSTIESSVQPGELTYEGAQIKNIEGEAEEIEKKIAKEHEENNAEINDAIKGDIYGLLKASAIAAGVSGVLSGAVHIYKDIQNGKNVFNGDYGADEYTHLAKTVGTAAGTGALSSAVFYTISDIAKRGNIAAALTINMVKGLAPIKLAYARGEISFAEFMNTSYAVSMSVLVNSLGEVGISAVIATFLGGFASFNISVPVLITIAVGIIGNVLGGFVLSKMISTANTFLNKDVDMMIAAHRENLYRISEYYNVELDLLENQFLSYQMSADIADDFQKPVTERVTALNLLSKAYGTEEITLGTDLDTLKARFIRR